ncbi:PAS domain S-box protein [Geobacter sp.]|uniref:PAS domain S-box protein n=1 Tax=Geobacter sp. TaxID=46610 RepID=UPI00262B489A|nr:PAS domain S-box protein [Geobacter sp.]
MPASDIKQEKTYQKQELRTQRQEAFASELFQDDVTVRTLLESLAEAVVIIDKSGIILLVNSLAEQLFGYPKKDLIGRHISCFYSEEDQKAGKPEDELKKAAVEGRADGQGWRARKDGSRFWADVIITALHDENGNLRGFVCQDVTERKRAEESLRRSEQKFFLAFQATPSVLVIASLEDGRYIEVNEAFERVMGYRRDEVIGRSSLDLQIWQNPEDRAMVLRMLAEGKKVRDLEIGFRCKAGTIIIGLYSAEIIEIGVERCLVSLVNDITARKKAEEELRYSEERYRSLYNETPVMLHSIDRDGRLISVSDYWLETLGYERSEVLGRKSTEFLTAASRRHASEIVLPEFYRTGFCKEVPYQFVKKNGEILEVLLSAIAERDSGGTIIRSLAVMTDVTARKRAEEEIEILNTNLAARAFELETANRELETFSYSVSHDLRKPLTIINGYCQLIQELCGNNLSVQCRGYLQEIHDGTLSMNQLIDALLRFSRLAHVEPHRETVDLSAMAREVAEKLKLAEPGRRVTFLIADGVRAEGDAGLLRVVLDNLLGNAWKYTGALDEGIIEFGTIKVEGQPACFVRDNGAGFDMADVEKLFSPFQRLSGTAEFGGHGIGLATVQRIIHRHGGRVWAEGEPGKGATFYFTLC